MTASRMFNPPHPGAVLREYFPEGMTVTEAAKQLKVTRLTISKILNGHHGITADMAHRLAAWLGTSPESWAGMQTEYELWQASKRKMPKIKPLEHRAPA
jgi:addiction module HigA family antidote